MHDIALGIACMLYGLAASLYGYRAILMTRSHLLTLPLKRSIAGRASR